MNYEIHSPTELRNIAELLATTAKPGDIYCLTGELAAGKTEFAKGVALGLGIGGLVTSPTFTIVNEYHGGRLPLYHFDVYRISAPEQMRDTGYEEYFYGSGVCVIEWAELISELLPEHAVIITIEKDFARGEGFRRIRIT